jgi:predicted transcriptional regulator of viral defense system
MNRLDIVKKLEEQHLSVFTTQQVATLLGAGVKTAAVALHRLVRDKVLVRVTRGRFCLPGTPVLSVASNIYPPSYVSLWSAFEYHGTTTQSPRVVDVVTTRFSGRLKVALEHGTYAIRFLKVGPSFIYGQGKVLIEGKAAFIADLERAMVDGLMYPGRVPVDEVAGMLRGRIRPALAIEYARRTGRQSVMKRTGFLLNLLGYECGPADLGRLSGTYVLLDPARPRRGKYDKTWRIIMNTVIE